MKNAHWRDVIFYELVFINPFSLVLSFSRLFGATAGVSSDGDLGFGAGVCVLVVRAASTQTKLQPHRHHPRRPLLHGKHRRQHGEQRPRAAQPDQEPHREERFQRQPAGKRAALRRQEQRQRQNPDAFLRIHQTSARRLQQASTEGALSTSAGLHAGGQGRQPEPQRHGCQKSPLD